MKTGQDSQFVFPDTPHGYFLPSQEEIAACDRRTIQAGTPSSELMERAGTALATRLSELFTPDQLRRLCILCGPGNNGGDGLVVARLLKDLQPEVFLVQAEQYSSDLLEQREKLSTAGIALHLVADDLGPLRDSLSKSTVILDACLGSGQKDAPRGRIKEMIGLAAELKTAEKHLVAIDIPTGMNGSTGEVYDCSFPSDVTLCIELVKRGLTQFPARNLCGRVYALPIGLDCSEQIEFSANDWSELARILNRPQNSHKGSFGSVLVVGGSAAMPGAPSLSAHAALVTGSGIVRKTHLRSFQADFDLPEVMRVVLGSDAAHYRVTDLEELLPVLDEEPVLVLGPGLGTDPETAEFVLSLQQAIQERKLSAVYDADALTLIARAESDALDFSRGVFTPHPGEMGRLLNIDTRAVERDRFSAIKKACSEYKTSCVLKGASSIVYGAQSGFVNLHGTAFMATAGSGDVLSGLIAGLRAQGLSPLAAARCGVAVHALAGIKASGGAPMRASAIVEAIPEAIRSLSEDG